MSEARDEPLAAEDALHDVTDEEWYDAHTALVNSGAIPTEEAGFIWMPGARSERFDTRPQVDYEANENG